jgi:hypothetical protein
MAQHTPATYRAKGREELNLPPGATALLVIDAAGGRPAAGARRARREGGRHPPAGRRRRRPRAQRMKRRLLLAVQIISTLALIGLAVRTLDLSAAAAILLATDPGLTLVGFGLLLTHPAHLDGRSATTAPGDAAVAFNRRQDK